MSLFSKIGAAISGFFTKELPVVEHAFISAEKAVNVVKTFMGTATGQTLEAVIEALVPGVGTAVFAGLNVFFKDFGLVTTTIDNEKNKTPAEIAADGLNAAAKLTGNSKILALSNIAAIIGHEASNAANGGSTLQQAIVALPIIHDPETLGVQPAQPNLNPGIVNAPVGTILPDGNVVLESAEDALKEQAAPNQQAQ